MKKTPKKPCKKACKKTGEKLCVDPNIRKIAMDIKPTLNVILENIVEDNRKKLNLYSDIAVKAGEVLKFLLQLVKESKDSYDNLSKILNAKKSEKVDLGDKGICVKENQVSPFSGTLFKILLGKSKYDFSGFDIDYRRIPKFDTDNTLAYEFRVSKKTEQRDGTVSVTQENAIVHASNDMDASVDEFDKIVGNLITNVPLKKGCCEKKCDGKCEKKCAKPITLKPKVVPCKRKPIVPVIEDLKKTVLECSKYAVPSSRVRFVAYRVDPKHGNFVYEVRFYQKSTKSVPVDKQSYEPAYLNVRMYGDRDDLIAKRFDKIVEGLRFSSFQEKK